MKIKTIHALPGYPEVGKSYEVATGDEAKAKGLIAAGLAEEDTTATPPPESLGDVVRSEIQKGLTEIRTQLGSKGNSAKRPNESAEPDEDRRVWAEAKRYGRLKNFSNDDRGREQAYRFGMFCLGAIAIAPLQGEKRFNTSSVLQKCQRLGLVHKGFVDTIEGKTSNERANQSAAFLVPDEFQNDLIDLREKFGVFRQNAKIVPMASDTRSDPRRRQGVTAYFQGEDTAGTLSDKVWDRVKLTAKKLMVLTKFSNELNEDAVINIGDDLAGEIAYAFALKEDQCGFNGDGTSTYGNIIGVRQSLLNVDSTIGNVLGLTVGPAGTGASYQSFTLANFNSVVGALPEFADSPNAKWYVHKTFWGAVMQKLAAAAGGNRIADIEGGALKKTFLGYDVVISQVMPKTPAINQVCALFGDLRMAASLGDRRQTTIQMSDSALNAFEQDEIVIRGTERFDINVHDVGESSAGTARDANVGLQAGPIVGLATASS